MITLNLGNAAISCLLNILMDAIPCLGQRELFLSPLLRRVAGAARSGGVLELSRFEGELLQQLVGDYSFDEVQGLCGWLIPEDMEELKAALTEALSALSALSAKEPDAEGVSVNLNEVDAVVLRFALIGMADSLGNLTPDQIEEAFLPIDGMDSMAMRDAAMESMERVKAALVSAVGGA
jgi:hypothetical protein